MSEREMSETETDAEFLERMSESNEYGPRDCAYGLDFYRLLRLARRGAMVPDDRSCTCHPDDRPRPCQKRYALKDCWAALENTTALNAGDTTDDKD